MRGAERLWRIGAIAREAGVSPDTIRHYERIGVLPTAHRSEAGYRLYPSQALVRVRIVRAGLQFGFTLRELAGFFAARDRGAPPCRQVRASAERILERVDRHLAELQAARTALRRTLREWDARLAATAPGAAARLLDHLPAAGEARLGLRPDPRRRRGREA